MNHSDRDRQPNNPTPEQALRYLSVLGASGHVDDALSCVTKSSELVWAGDVARAALPPPRAHLTSTSSRSGELPMPDMAEAQLGELSRRNSLHAELMMARVGWIWVVHTTMSAGGGTDRRCFPLLQRAVDFRHSRGRVTPVWLRNIELNPALVDLAGQQAQAASKPLLQRPEHLSGLQAAQEQRHIAELLRLCGFEVTDVVDPAHHPLQAPTGLGVFVSIGAGFYLDRARNRPVTHRRLSLWGRYGTPVTGTAFGTLYGGRRSESKRALGGLRASRKHQPKRPLRAPGTGAHLNPKQREILERLRHETLVIASGPPGTGKTHLIAEAARLATQSGWSVAIATASAHAENAVTEMLDRSYTTYDRIGGTPSRGPAGRNKTLRSIRNELSEARASHANIERQLTAGLASDMSGARVDALLASLDQAAIRLNASTRRFEAAKRRRQRSWSSTLRPTRIGGYRWDPKGAFGYRHLLVGTIADIEQLATKPGLFDLVILDESSQVDLVSAAGVLCRGKRALIVGDPRQLRHWTPVEAPAVRRAMISAQIDDERLPTSLDVQANSLFDVAAGVSPVTTLTEHYRSLPHLIEFSGRRWYNDGLHVATRHPSNENADRIDTVYVRTTPQVHAADTELNAVLEYVRTHVGSRSPKTLGVIAPFPDQARMVEEALVAEYGYHAIVQTGLRVGTIDEMVGSERDIILITLGIVARQFDRALPILEDPERFNVMITRARDQLVLFHSFDPADLPAGLMRDYFHHEASPPGPPPSAGIVTSFQQELASSLRSHGHRVISNYPVGRWTIDMVVGQGPGAIALQTSGHPDGGSAHVAHQLALRQLGWRVVTMFDAEWRHDLDGAVAHVLAQMDGQTSSGEAE